MLKLWMRLLIIISIICTSFSPMTHLIVMLIAIITTQFLFLHFMTKLLVKRTLRNDSSLKLFREKTLINIELSNHFLYWILSSFFLGWYFGISALFCNSVQNSLWNNNTFYRSKVWVFFCVLELVLHVCESHSNQNNHLFKDFIQLKNQSCCFQFFSIPRFSLLCGYRPLVPHVPSQLTSLLPWRLSSWSIPH